jgi:zinc D-Ala-D-Ala dipeptidase
MNKKQGAPEPIAALNRVRILEYAVPFAEREPLVDIREFCPDVVVRENVCPYLRRGVAERVNAAQASLPAGYKLKVKSALRTLAAQRFGWDNYHKKLREEHPGWNLATLRRMTNKYFAPYDQPAPPGHCTGGAVDVGLIAPDGEELDLIAPTTGWEAAYTWSDKISPEAKQNRMLMVEAMLNAGFSNCRDEYWHYSYGDSAWAVRVGVKECPYGWTHPPVALEADFENASALIERVDSVREPQNGRVVSAKAWCAIPSDAEKFHVGVYWANGVPVTFHLNAPPEIPLYLGSNDDVWTPLDVFAAPHGVTVEFVPDADHVFVANYVPPPKPAETIAESETIEEVEEEQSEERSEATL